MNLTDITVSRIIPAPVEVFDLWMDPHSPGGPWSGSDRVILNPAVDGLFYLAVKHEGRTWPHYGRFLQINRPHQVEYTWMSEATKGAESVVNVTLQSRGEWAASTKKAGPGFSPPWPMPWLHAAPRRAPTNRPLPVLVR
jgi:uncharacterized protein YndB with AHSA1/START domain